MAIPGAECGTSIRSVVTFGCVMVLGTECKYCVGKGGVLVSRVGCNRPEKKGGRRESHTHPQTRYTLTGGGVGDDVVHGHEDVGVGALHQRPVAAAVGRVVGRDQVGALQSWENINASRLFRKKKRGRGGERSGQCKPKGNNLRWGARA